ncbi:834_t:CDS:2 [Cetraspora pellucida]|uniref:834_t:CDS:1 n=1 Tax=Cetraspora pellucida TaxID=1433469 RepID=A0A9N8ZVD8_9GLOM|nr:834_t:CDS:2 [Cetraspora pellucida]
MVKTKAKQLARQPHFTSLYLAINEYKWTQKLLEDLKSLKDAFLNNVLYY